MLLYPCSLTLLSSLCNCEWLLYLWRRNPLKHSEETHIICMFCFFGAQAAPTAQTTATLQKCQCLTPLTPRFSPITGGPVWPSTRTHSRSCTIPTRFPCSIRRATAAWWAQAAATTRSMFSPPPWRGWSSPRRLPRSHTQGECKHPTHTAHARHHCKCVLIFWHLLDCFMCSGNTLDSLLLSIVLINDAVSWHMAFLWL